MEESSWIFGCSHSYLRIWSNDFNHSCSHYIHRDWNEFIFDFIDKRYQGHSKYDQYLCKNFTTTIKNQETHHRIPSIPCKCKRVESIHCCVVNCLKIPIFYLFRLVEYYEGLFQPMFFVIFSLSLITICGGLLMIQMEIVPYFPQ